MKIQGVPLQGMLVIEPQCFIDERGFFLEVFQTRRYLDAGITDEFVQDNHSRSRKGVVRGIHFQVERPQAQLVTVVRGRIFDVGVDLRSGSPTFGQWCGVELADSGPRQLYMAPGFGHAFFVLSDWADLHYKVSQIYDPTDEGGLLWNDPDIGIRWPTNQPKISRRDAAYPRLRDIAPGRLPR